jgi:hypothetical protein
LIPWPSNNSPPVNPFSLLIKLEKSTTFKEEFMNTCILTGNLGADPESFYTPNEGMHVNRINPMPDWMLNSSSVKPVSLPFPDLERL